jgi:uncharacterized Fe-S cluster-containing radical SAM superfamily enzyme
MARYEGTDEDIQKAYDYYVKRVGRKSSKMDLQQFARFHYGRTPRKYDTARTQDVSQSLRSNMSEADIERLRGRK